MSKYRGAADTHRYAAIRYVPPPIRRYDEIHIDTDPIRAAHISGSDTHRYEPSPNSTIQLGYRPILTDAHARALTHAKHDTRA